MSNHYSAAVNTARDYYNSEDADRFYYTIWGGEDIHVGLYRADDEPIFEASRRTVQHMAERAAPTADSRVLDIGAGYGGSARYLAHRYGCQVVALNLSEVENARHREMNARAGLDHLIEVVDGSFEAIPYPDAHFDLVWSQDAILHSGDRSGVLREVDRVLRPGGEFLFTDPMQTDTCPPGVLQPILARIHLEGLGSPGFYRTLAADLGWRELAFDELAEQLPNHYGRVLRELEARRGELRGVVSDAYIERMKRGLRHWIEGGQNGYLTWGLLHFRKAAA